MFGVSEQTVRNNLRVLSQRVLRGQTRPSQRTLIPARSRSGHRGRVNKKWMATRQASSNLPSHIQTDLGTFFQPSDASTRTLTPALNDGSVGSTQAVIAKSSSALNVDYYELIGQLEQCMGTSLNGSTAAKFNLPSRGVERREFVALLLSCDDAPGISEILKQSGLFKYLKRTPTDGSSWSSATIGDGYCWLRVERQLQMREALRSDNVNGQVPDSIIECLRNRRPLPPELWESTSFSSTWKPGLYSKNFFQSAAALGCVDYDVLMWSSHAESQLASFSFQQVETICSRFQNNFKYDAHHFHLLPLEEAICVIDSGWQNCIRKKAKSTKAGIIEVRDLQAEWKEAFNSLVEKVLHTLHCWKRLQQGDIGGPRPDEPSAPEFQAMRVPPTLSRPDWSLLSTHLLHCQYLGRRSLSHHVVLWSRKAYVSVLSDLENEMIQPIPSSVQMEVYLFRLMRLPTLLFSRSPKDIRDLVTRWLNGDWSSADNIDLTSQGVSRPSARSRQDHERFGLRFVQTSAGWPDFESFRRTLARPASYSG